MTKFMVIGSNSFSGSNFIRTLLLKNFKVIGISRSDELKDVFLPYKWIDSNKNENTFKNFKFFRIDLNKSIDQLFEIIDQNRPTHIINFAAQGMVAESWLNPSHWYQTNVVAQVLLHDGLRKRNFLEKYIHITTPEVYGSTNNKWINEKTKFNPTTPYAVSRAACDMHLESFFKAYNFPVIFTRAANVFGPGQQLYRIIPRTILSALTGIPLDLHGGGLSERCFIHINDVVEATLKLAFYSPTGSTWHISTKDPLSIRDLVKKICCLTNRDFKEIVNDSDERVGKDQSYFLDSTKLRKKFNWEENYSLEQGLCETIEWVSNNLELFKNLSWKYHHKL